MGISTQRVKLDINKQASMQVIRLGQGDKNGTTLIAELYDGGSPYNLSGKTARFTMRTPDRRSSYSVNASSTSNNTATFNIDERYAAGVAGTTDVAYIEVLSGSTVICSTSRMRVICLQSATEGVSPSQMHDNGLDAAIAAANAAASSANTAASNANTKASRAETATTNANTARDNANSAASAANTAASAATTAAGSATTAAEAANSAKDAANTAATAANTAADSANAATSEANAAIEAIGDISELAVPEMTASVRGGAKVGGSTQVIGGKLEVKLSESATGTSVTTGSTSALRELQVHGRSVQDGIPTPDAPVSVEVVGAKNLLDVTMTSQTMNGLTFVVNPDKTISVTGTASSDTYVTVGSVSLPDGTYRLSGCPAGGSRTTYRLYYNRSGAVEFDYGGGVTIIANNEGSVQVRIAIYTGTTVDMVFRPQIELGSTNTPYVPYGSIGIVVGDTATPIELQGNTLASLPDGTHDELHIDSAGHCVLTKTVSHIASYNGESVGSVYMSTTGQLTTGAEVYYKASSASTIDLGYIDQPAIPSGSVVTISASLTPTFDLSCWTEHASELADITDAITTLAGMVIGDEQESIASSIAPVEGSTASANHAVDDYLMLGARLYRVTTAIASGERIIPGTNVTETTVMAEIVSLLS